MPNVFLKRQSESELHFQHSFLGGWIFAAIGCGILYFGILHAESSSARWVAIGMGAFFAAIGLGGALWRHELTLDLSTRRYRGQRGFWPSPGKLQGSLDELAGVVLTHTLRRNKDSDHPVWVVSLDFSGWEKPFSFFETTSERKGYRKFEEIARRLRTSAIDRTGEQEIKRTYDELDRSVADRERGGGEPGARIEEPPPGSGIEWTRSEIGAPMIVLPALGFNVAAVFLALFGLPFLGFGGVALASALGWSGVEVSGSLTAKCVVGGVFVVIGIVCWAGAVFGSVAREVFREDRDAIVVSYFAFGRHYRNRRLPWRDIEDISIKPRGSSGSRRSGPANTEVVLRSDEIVARVAGDLPPDSQRWLCLTLLALARR
jgi:hypothetical protein